MEFLSGVGIAVGVAVVIALSTFVTKFQKGEAFQPRKLIRTLLVGVVIGIIAHLKGVTITADNYEAYLLANAGIIGVADQAVKFFYRLIVKSDG